MQKAKKIKIIIILDSLLVLVLTGAVSFVLAISLLINSLGSFCSSVFDKLGRIFLFWGDGSGQNGFNFFERHMGLTMIFLLAMVIIQIFYGFFAIAFSREKPWARKPIIAHHYVCLPVIVFLVISIVISIARSNLSGGIDDLIAASVVALILLGYGYAKFRVIHYLKNSL